MLRVMKAMLVILAVIVSLVVMGIPVMVIGSITTALGEVEKKILNWGTKKLDQYIQEGRASSKVDHLIRQLNKTP